MNDDRTAASRSEIEDLVHTLARQEHLADPAISWDRKDDADTDPWTTPPTIHMPPAMLARPARVRSAAAHEIGHLINARDELETRAGARHLRRMVRSALSMAVAPLFVAIALVERDMLPPVALGVSLVWMLVVVLGIFRWFGIRQRPYEIAADRHGADLGYPCTADQFPAKDLRTGPIARIGNWIYPAHPLRADRIADVADYLSTRQQTAGSPEAGD